MCSRVFTWLLRQWRQAWILPIRFYQLVISPWLPATCIYSPTCSNYTRQAILSHGVLRGLAISLLRVGRCAGGLYNGGTDSVPDTIEWKSIFLEYRTRWRRTR